MRKYLDGELVWREGVTNVGNLIRNISEQMAAKVWTPILQDGTLTPWVFDLNREITLDQTYQKEDLKLFNSIAQTRIVPLGDPVGEIRILKSPSEDGTINLQVNEKNFIIPFSLGQSITDVVNNIVTTLSSDPDFGLTSADGDKVIITGDEPIYILEARDYVTSSDYLVANTKVSTNEVRTNKIEVLTSVFSQNPLDTTINIDGTLVTVPLVGGMSKEEIASTIAEVVKVNTPYFLSRAEGEFVYIAGTQSISQFTSEENVNSFVGLKLDVTPQGYGTTIVLNDSAEEGLVTVTITTGTGDISASISVSSGETKSSIAERLASQMTIEWGGTHTVEPGSSTIISILGAGQTITAITSTLEISDLAQFAMVRRVSEPKTWASFQIVNKPEVEQSFSLTLDSTDFTFVSYPYETVTSLLTRMSNNIVKNPLYPIAGIQNDILYIYGVNTIRSASSNIDIPNTAISMTLDIVKPSKNEGEITVRRAPYKATENLNLIVNKVLYTIPITNAMTTDQIASEIATKLATYPEYIDTVAVGSVVTISGTASVLDCQIEPVEIDEASYTVTGSVIRGIGGIDSGTESGDSVTIKTNQSSVIFDFSTIEGYKNNYNEDIAYATLKSRPRGAVKVYEAITYPFVDTILNSANSQTYNIGHQIVVDSAILPFTVKEDDILVDKSEYILDKFNGVLYFLAPRTGVIKVSGSYVDPIYFGTEIPVDSYKLIDNTIVDSTALLELKDKTIVVTVDYSWDLVYPSTFALIDPENPRCVIKTSVDVSANMGRGTLKDFYVEMRAASGENAKFTSIEIRFGDKLEASSQSTIDPAFSSPWVRASWYKEEAVTSGAISLSSDSPIFYSMNFTAEYANIVLQGDPALDSNYTNYQICPINLGLLDNYDGEKSIGREGKFILSAGSDKTPTYSTKWGQRTGNGNTDLILFRTKSNMPYQGHSLAFYSSQEFMEKHFLGASSYTNMYHFSEPSVFHNVEREVGKIPSVLIGDRSAIFHRDTLISNKDEFNDFGALLDENGEFINREKTSLVTSKEKEWKMFNINSYFWSGGNKSPNLFYGLALRVR